MIRVAWVARHPLFSGVIGGAEMADEAMIRTHPDNVEVWHYEGWHPGLEKANRVIVTRPDNLTEEEAEAIAPLHPIVWPHGATWQVAGHAKAMLEASSLFIALTPDHLAREQQWLTLERTAVNPGWMDLREFPSPSTERSGALWAHRNVWHKDVERAIAWARDQGIPLTLMSDSPRAEVLEAMAQAQYFVLLSAIYDPGPRAVIEAQLMGCELVLDNVGYFDESREELRLRIDRADRDFWGAVLA